MMNLETIGSFHAGGRRVTVSDESVRTIWFTPDVSFDYDPNGDYVIEQCYVQYFIPAEASGRLPVVLVHGGGMCGSIWDSTPDGRPGWLQVFLEQGFPVYVVDGVERGRAGFNATAEAWPDEPLMRTEREAWDLFRFGPSGGYEARTVYADCQFPIAHLEALTRHTMPRWTSTTAASISALESALERIGPCTIVAHSQGGAISNDIAVRRPDLVRAMVGVEASGFPQDLPATVAETRWLWVLGDHLDHDDTARFLESGATAFSDRLTQTGAQSHMLNTPSFAGRGNTHMLMMDAESERIAREICGWIEAQGLSA